MLKKNNRINKRNSFLEIKEKGNIFQSPSFGFAFIKNDDDQKRFGFVISKKISKKAVVRNKIKRLLAESIRKNLNEIPSGVKGIFLVKKEIIDKSFDLINEEVKKIINKLQN